MAQAIYQKASDAMKDNVVSPIPRPSDGLKAYRVEIDEFLADNTMTNLFLIALKELQNESLTTSKKADNWWSFYALSGIHGQPRESWSGLGNVGENGYCHHGMPTFPTWHRAYMFQFEQAIYIRMYEIASKYPENSKDKYLSAAARFRLPFWDPIMPRHRDDTGATFNAKRNNSWFWGVPQILQTKDVFVRYPDSADKLTSMPNPLYQFDFPSEKVFSETKTKRTKIDFKKDTDQGWLLNERWEKVSFDSKTGGAVHTVRAPTIKSKGESDHGLLEENIQLQMRSLATYFWQLLSPVKDNKGSISSVNESRTWDMFSNHSDVRSDRGFKEWVTPDGQEGHNGGARSLESWHDSIHNLISTGFRYAGHMGDPAVAAFDPIFWLHHNNIERMLCIYQALYPERYVTSGKASQGRKARADDYLYPFLKQKGTYFTSTDLRDWTKSGYATPGDNKDVAGLRDSLSKYLLANYYWATLQDAKPNFEKLDYPKDFSQVEALTGKPNVMADRPVSFKAMSLQNGQASFVSSKMARRAEEQVPDQLVAQSIITEQIMLTEEVYPTEALNNADVKDIDTTMTTWNAQIRIKKFAYRQSFNIHLFIGDISEARSQNYMHRMNEAGFSGVFMSPDTEGCSNCRRSEESDSIYIDLVPLTNILIDYLASNPKSEGLIAEGHTTIRNLSPDEVVPFLQQNLQWRMQSLTGAPLPYDPESSLEVAVSGRIFTPPSAGDLLGHYSPSRIYAQITAGKDGGYAGADVDVEN